MTDNKKFSFYLDEEKIYHITVDEKSIEVSDTECYTCKSLKKNSFFQCVVFDGNLHREIICKNCWVCIDGCGDCVCREKNKEEFLLCKINNDENILKSKTYNKVNENEWQFLHYFLYGDGREYFSQLLLK
jgi:hypothetical protein